MITKTAQQIKLALMTDDPKFKEALKSNRAFRQEFMEKIVRGNGSGADAENLYNKHFGRGAASVGARASAGGFSGRGFSSGGSSGPRWKGPGFDFGEAYRQAQRDMYTPPRRGFSMGSKVGLGLAAGATGLGMYDFYRSMKRRQEAKA